ncbi:MAG: glycoside hydrolase family 9 protein [Clostridia bacterium]|nr:glycoside hydrolase family 9 protein [Clostridia bacterium]
MKPANDFYAALFQSGILHRPLPVPEDDPHALKTILAAKPVHKEKILWNGGIGKNLPTGGGPGTVSVCETDGSRVLRLTADLTADHWPAGAPQDGDYTNFGTAAFSFSLSGENWEDFDRLRFRVRPDIPSSYVLHLNVSVRNEGKIPVPDEYWREGATVFDLKNGQWNDCIWEFPSMGRDRITNLTFYVFLSGQAADWGAKLLYDFADIRLESTGDAEHERGWQCRKNTITLSSAGYFPEGSKTAVADVDADIFRVHDARDGHAVYEGQVKRVSNPRGNFCVLDFSEIPEGQYYLTAGDVQSCVFPVSSAIGTEPVWKLLNFVYCLRCGYAVPGKHGACHLDSMAEHNGVKLSFSGGWHDAGDLSQQALQSGEMVHALLEAAELYKGEPLLRARLLEEAEWGLDFILRTRFGDGFRATSAGCTRYTRNLVGDFDDVAVRVYDHSYENFLFSGVEAYACTVLKEINPAAAEGSLSAAREDYDFACKKFAETGVDPAHMYEHTFGSGLSQYYAVITWAAANLFRAAGDRKYADDAAKYAGKLIDCQEQGAAGLPFTGFFYRDESHASIVHFNHQAREHQFLQALTLVCDVLKDHPDRAAWVQAIARYADYVKAVIGNTAPYSMMPAGVHRLDEPEDQALFPYMHILTDYWQQKPHYEAQLSNGLKLDENHVLKNFPVWFSFRGNSAVQLSSGIAAAEAGICLDDPVMRSIGREQLYWMWGKNPFGQSLQYGVGERYPAEYGVYVGECIGEVPVGVQTAMDEDIPYWPQTNNATYKEVWIGTACRMLWLLNSCRKMTENERNTEI